MPIWWWCWLAGLPLNNNCCCNANLQQSWLFVNLVRMTSVCWMWAGDLGFCRILIELWALYLSWQYCIMIVLYLFGVDVCVLCCYWCICHRDGQFVTLIVNFCQTRALQHKLWGSTKIKWAKKAYFHDTRSTRPAGRQDRAVHHLLFNKLKIQPLGWG